jgi:hypothetical protein
MDVWSDCLFFIPANIFKGVLIVLCHDEPSPWILKWSLFFYSSKLLNTMLFALTSLLTTSTECEFICFVTLCDASCFIVINMTQQTPHLSEQVFTEPSNNIWNRSLVYETMYIEVVPVLEELTSRCNSEQKAVQLKWQWLSLLLQVKLGKSVGHGHRVYTALWSRTEY